LPITLVARDAFGNRRSRGRDEVRIQVRGSQYLSCTVADCGDGTYTSTFPRRVAGSFQLDVTIQGTTMLLRRLGL
jgi:hypothetical protein